MAEKSILEPCHEACRPYIKNSFYQMLLHILKILHAKNEDNPIRHKKNGQDQHFTKNGENPKRAKGNRTSNLKIKNPFFQILDEHILNVLHAENDVVQNLVNEKMAMFCSGHSHGQYLYLH
jgi:hypothetical protein